MAARVPTERIRKTDGSGQLAGSRPGVQDASVGGRRSAEIGDDPQVLADRAGAVDGGDGDGRAVRLVEAGLTVEQADEAIAAGLDVEQFVEHSIRNGITFAEAMDAHAAIGDIGYYNYIREEAGCGHAAAMLAFADADVDLEGWAVEHREEKQARQFDPSTERPEFGKSRMYQCEPGTEVFLETAIFPSNTYIGSSQAYGKVYRRHRMGADDRVVDAAGGRFVATADGRVFMARFSPQDRHLFERGGPTADPAPSVGYRCEPLPLAELGGRHKAETVDAPQVYASMSRFGAMDYVENTGPGL